jgi:hypothetical protein
MQNLSHPAFPSSTYPASGTQAHDIAYNRPGGLSSIATPASMGLNHSDFATQRKFAAASEQLLREDAILRQWLEGDTIQQIMGSTGFSWATVVAYIKKGRQHLKEAMDDDLSNLAVERVEAFRDIKRRAICLVNIQPRLAPQLLRVAMDAEVNIGKIQGVLNDKVLHIGKIQHEHKKMYDFVDTLPPAPGEDATDNSAAVDAAYELLNEPLIQPSSAPLAPFHPRSYATTPAQSDLRRTQRDRIQKGKDAVESEPMFVIG